MKKLLYFAAALLTFAACEKEVEAPVEKATPATYKVTIKAGFADETKTAYDAAGKFSWVAGDKIGVMVQKEGELKQVTFTAKSAGAVTEFEGEVEEGWTVAEYASYPFTGVTDGYARNDFAWDKSNGEEYGWRLWGSIKPDLENPLASTPLIAKKDAEGYYSFKTATGILKFTVKNVPFETYYAYLEVPSETKEQYNLNGWYSLNDEGLPTMATAIEPWENRYNWNVPTDYNQTMDYYFFVPEGTLPVGTKFELCNSSWAPIKSFEVKTAVEVVRNRVTNVAPVEIEAYSPNLEENQIWIKPWNIVVNNDAIYTSNGNPYEGGGVPALVDGNPENYWHSAWYAADGFFDPTVHDDKYGITIDITLEEAIKDFSVSYYVRHNNNNGEPREIIFACSNDGETWTDIQTFADDAVMKVPAGSRVDIPKMSAEAEFKHLRLGITKAGNGDTPNDLTAGSGSTALGELLLFKAAEVTPPEPTTSFVKVTSNDEIADGVRYLFVYEPDGKVFNGGLETLDAKENTIDVTIEDGKIPATEAVLGAVFTFDLTQGTIKSASGFYISNTTGSSYSNGLKQNAEATAPYLGHTITINESGYVIAQLIRDNAGEEGHMILNYNSNTSEKRFRYYKEGNQKQINLYRYEEDELPATPEDGGSGVPDYDPITGFEW